MARMRNTVNVHRSGVRRNVNNLIKWRIAIQLLNPLSPHDALKHHFAYLKNDLISGLKGLKGLIYSISSTEFVFFCN